MAVFPNKNPTQWASSQFARGLKFGNVPGGKPMFIKGTADQPKHVSTTMTVLESTSDNDQYKIGLYSGAIKYRFRNMKHFAVPSAISPPEGRNTNQFGVTKYPGVN
jgi:hypothetical protein